MDLSSSVGTDLQGGVFVRGSVPQYVLCLIISCFLQISFIVLARQGIKVKEIESIAINIPR